MYKIINVVAVLVAVGLAYDMSPVSYDMNPVVNVSYEFAPPVVEEVVVKPEVKKPTPKPVAKKPNNRLFGRWRRR